ncbi:MAG: sensor histidine kinase [Saprospiraceae bacterium]|nr:sensor histidine kinase [Saprospiraceae bacterium]
MLSILSEMRSPLNTMIRGITVVLLFICLNRSTLIAQNNTYVDSLQTAIGDAKNTQDSIIPLRQLARYYMRYDLKLSRLYTGMYYKAAYALHDSFHQAVANHYFGLVNRLESNYSDALKHFQDALLLFQKDTLRPENGLGPIFNIGVVYQTIGDFEKALQYFYRELDLRNQVSMSQGYGNTLNSIGVTLKKMGNYQQARDIYSQALEKCLEAGDSVDLSNIYNNRGQARELMGDYVGALDDYRLSLQIDTKDGYKSGIASSYESMSRIYLNFNQLDSARYFALEAYQIRQDLGQLQELIQSGHNMVEVSLKTGRLDDAWMYAELTTPKCNQLGLPDLVMTNYALLADIYRMKGDPLLEGEALRAQLAWKDSLHNKQTHEAAQNLQIRYETKEKEHALASLQNENELNNLLILRQRKWQLTLLIALGLLTFLLVLAVRFYQLKIESHQLKREQDQLIEKQKIKDIEAENKILQMNAMLRGEEAERLRIAKDLHDGLGALLATVKFHFASVQKKIQVLSDLKLYQKANQLLDNACSEVRRIAHNMMPDALSKLGLIQALEDLVEALRLEGYKVTVETINMDQQLPEEVELMVYRIVQELINNISKHAKADTIIVQLSIHDQQLTISVEDDGCGFDINRTTDGIGLKNLRSRVAYLGGILEIDSVDKIGTTTNVVIPVPLYSMAAN